MNYAHRFHAGNFADVHKHLVLTGVLIHLSQKPTPWFYLDTHAGNGLYPLQEGREAARVEFSTGVLPLFNASISHPILETYQSILRRYNPEGTLLRYPGSPLIADALARPDDRLAVTECVPERARELRQYLAGRPAHVHCRDGYEALGALLPPREKRGLVLIDPPYESTREREVLLKALSHALERFPRGTYVIWHPWVDPAFVAGLRRGLERLGPVAFLDWQTTRRQGLRGSGLAVFNLPYGLASELAALWPQLRDLYASTLGPVEFTQTGIPKSITRRRETGT